MRVPRLTELQPFDTPTVEPTLATAGISQNRINRGALPLLHRLE